MDIGSITLALETLTKPVNCPNLDGDLEFLLEKNIENVKALLDPTLLKTTEELTDPRWRFTLLCLDLLLSLCQCMDECLEREKSDPQFTNPKLNSAPPLSAAALSIGHQRTIASVLQFIGLIGISPNLSVGVGIPLNLRTNYKHLLTQPQKLELSVRKSRLLRCVQVLLKCVELPDLKTLVLTLHLNDLLASLCQISYEPEETGKNSICSCTGGNSKICDARICVGKIEVEQSLLELMNTVKPEVLIREIMVLQGGSGRMKPTIRGLEKPVLAPSSPWLRRVCGRLLSEQLVKENGVRHVTAAMLDGTTEEKAEWRKCDALAGIIATSPKHLKADEYVENICGQLLTLLRHDDDVTPWQTRIVVSCVRALYVKHSAPTGRHFLEAVLRPMQCCLEPGADGGDGVIIEEDDLINCLESVYQLFVMRPDAEFMTLLLPFCHPLFSLYARSRGGVSYARKMVEESLMTLLKHQDADVTFRLLLSLAYQEPATFDGVTVRTMSPVLSVRTGPGGGYRIVRDSGEDVEVGRVSALSDLVLSLQTDGVAGRFFLHLLQELTTIISEHHDNKSGFHGNSSDTELLTLEERQERVMKRRLVVVQLLGELSGKFDHSCLQEPKHVIAFAKATLERGVYVLQQSDDDLMSAFENETMSMAMSLLTALMGGAAKLSTEDRVAMETLLPLLNDIATNHPDDNIREMATDIRIAIATRGAVLGLSRQEGSTAGDKETHETESEIESGYKTKPLIEVISESEGKPERKPLIEVISDKHNSEVVLSKFQQAMEELCDPLVPVRGHALISLRKLVQNGDQETLENKSLLKTIFVENIDHKDTYIYLSAIEGLALLSDKYPDELVPLICEQFGQGQRSRSPELRLKLGEVLVKMSRGLGEMLPHYGGRLLSTFLGACHDDEASVRASSLANLGQVSRMLKWSLGKNVHEICSCCTALLRTDTDVTVRRAAASMIHQLLEGTDQATIQVLETTIRDLYRQLKRTSETETDDAVLTHARRALTSLDDVMKSVLFPRQELRKEIRIMDPF